jgi:hypothetical protein
VTYSGNLGGLAGGDAKCQALATAAGRSGSYKAWLSDDSSTPATRFTPFAGPYALFDDTMIAASWSQLIGHVLLHEINIDEHGQTPTSDYAWTGSAWDGTRCGSLNNCGGWVSTSGNGCEGSDAFLQTGWSYFANLTCSSQARLYCFEQ